MGSSVLGSSLTSSTGSAHRSFLSLVIAHFAANAVVLGAGYYWLGLSDSRGATIIWSALLAAALFLLGCATYAAAFAYFGVAGPKSVSAAWRTAARNILPLAAAALAITLLYWLLSLWQDFSKGPAFLLASFLTLTFRRPFAPATMLKIFDAILFLVRWVVLPVLILPILAKVSSRGWSGFGLAGRDLKPWWFWVAAPVLLLAAGWAPFAILSWKPHMSNFSMEVVSFTLRAAAAYLLFAGGWLAVAFATCAGRPSLAQPSTAVSP